MKHAVATFAAIIMAAVFFATPLILKYHVYKPSSKKVITGDVVSVSGTFSSVWCQAVELASNSTFRSFVFYKEPDVIPFEIERTVQTHRIVLPNKAQEYLGFHLLAGSQVKIAACVRLFSGDLTIVQGHHGLHRCLREHKRHSERVEEFSGEDSQSETQSDDDTSSISSSQGAVSNETDDMLVCSNALYHVMLPTLHKCNSEFSTYARQHVVLHDIQETDYYYYIFTSEMYLDIIPNEFSLEFYIDRTHYDYSKSSDNCSSANQCRLSISFASDQRIVVQMDGINGSLEIDKLNISCKPREGLFCIFYAGFLIVIFLCAFQ